MMAMASFTYLQGFSLPEDTGKDLILSRCNICHGIDIVVNQRLNRLGWEEIVDRMIRWGAPITPQERILIIEYLYKHFGEK